MFSSQFTTEENLFDICADALAAFSLVLPKDNQKGVARDGPAEATVSAEAAESAFSILKSDAFSLVVKVRCAPEDSLELTHSAFYVLKRISSAFFSGSEEAAKVHNSFLPLSGFERLTTPERQYLFREPDSLGGCNVWSATRFIESAPSFDWLDQVPSWTEVQTHSAGGLLARLHHKAYVLRNTFAGESFALMQSVIPLIPDWLEQTFAAISLGSKSASDYFEGTDSLKELLPEARQALILVQVARLVSEHELAREEQLMVHGDFHPGNVLFAQEQAICVIDWDYAHSEDPLLDLAYGLIMFAAKFASSDNDSLDQKHVIAFLQGYCDGSAQTGWSLASAYQEKFVDAEGKNSSTIEPAILAVLLVPYIKIAASLILLWSLSEQGMRYKCQTTVARKAVHLILHEL